MQAVPNGKLLQVGLDVIIPRILLSFGVSYACVAATHASVTLPHTHSPDWVAEAKKIGPVAQRTEAPAVFLNPIRNKIPGSVLGPEDLENE